jgi:small-conductance mechanosensitive channel
LRPAPIAARSGLLVLAGALFPIWFSPAPSSAAATHDSIAAADSAVALEREQAEFDQAAGYPLLLDGREIFRVLVPERARPAEERARAGSDRLLRFARSSSPVDPVSYRREGSGVDVVFGRIMVFTVYDADAAAEGTTAEELAMRRAGAVRSAILEYREERSTRSIALGFLIAVLAVLGLGLALKGIAVLHRRLSGAMGAWIAAREEKGRKRAAGVVPAAHLLRALKGVTGLLRLALTLIVLYACLDIVLGAFPGTRAAARGLHGMILGPLGVLGKSALDALPGLVFIAIVALVTRYALRLLHLLFLEIEGGRIEIQGFYPEWAKPTYTIVRVLAVFFAVIVSYPYIPGSDSDAFKGVSIFLGVLLSLGSTSAVANLVAGFVITYMRAYRVGDYVSVGEDRGEVTEMTILATHLRTPKNVLVTVPNATVLSSRVVNYSALAKNHGLILHTTVTVGYDAPWRQVHALLLQAAGRTPGILKEPAPFVLQREMQQVQIAYELNAYVESPVGMLRTYSNLHKNIQDAFNEYGVQIMTPFYEGDKPAPLVVPKERWYAAPARKPGEPGADE